MRKDFFVRGVAEIIEEKSLKDKLKSGKTLRIKMGVDPTRPDLHLGHTVAIRKLREFQEAGHKVIFLIGDFTAKVGDPSGKNKTRPMLDDQDILRNAQTYLDQVGKILDIEKTELRRNSEWYSKMDFNDILQVAAKFTVAQILERDDFEKRLKGGSDIGMHELLYPIMQAYDSVMLEADVEMGGTDQKFNMLAGRSLQKKMGQAPQDVMTMKLLVGLDGKEKMSKSLDNYVSITEEPSLQFGKIMSIPDNLIIEYFDLCTDIPKTTVAKYQSEMENGANPRDYKEKLALEIVKMYHGSESAKEAKESFVRQFREKELPEDMPEVKLEGRYKLPLLLISLGAVGSNSEARRLIEQGGVRVDGAKLEDPNSIVSVYGGMVVQVGKRRFYKIK
ncbi:MAG: Tyrosine--tRNA ligase [bacterium ADurb.Bin400]|nr:MAG: Tyrosine--tRNA ligase [bacterium ADurb.Bin400]